MHFNHNEFWELPQNQTFIKVFQEPRSNLYILQHVLHAFIFAVWLCINMKSKGMFWIWTKTYKWCMNYLQRILYPWKSTTLKSSTRTWCEARRFIKTSSQLCTQPDRQSAPSDNITMVTRPVDLLSEEEQMMKESGIDQYMHLTPLYM